MMSHKPDEYNSWSDSAKQAYDSLLERTRMAEEQLKKQTSSITNPFYLNDVPEELRARLDYLLYDAKQTLDPTHIFIAILEIICEHLDVTSAYILDWDSSIKTATILAEFIAPDAHPKEHEANLGIAYQLDDTFQRQLNQNPHYWSVDATIDPPSYTDNLQYPAYNVHSSLFVPMYANVDFIGFFEIWDTRKRREFTREQCDFVLAIAQQLSNSVYLAKLHRALADSDNRYRMLMKHMQSGVIQTTMKNQIQYINEYGLNLLGLSEKDVLEHSFQDIWESRTVSTPVTNEFKTRHGQPTKWLTMTTTTIHNDAKQSIGIVHIITDVTERKVAEDQAISVGIEKERVNLLHEFIQAASHEFFTPISIINTKLYLLARHIAEDQPHLHELLSSVKEQSTIITDLVNALVQVVRLDSISKASLRFINLNSMIEDAIATCQPHSQMKNQQLELHIEFSRTRYLCNSTLIVNTLIKIIQNAIQYTPEDGSIIVRAYKTTDHIVIEVQDTGIGMSEETQVKMFDRFYREDKARSARGFGLGLSYAKRVIELHEGAINVESELGAGTTVRILLPLMLSEDVLFQGNKKKEDAPSEHPPM